jgi:Ca2+-binding EF-hand superfamily protein
MGYISTYFDKVFKKLDKDNNGKLDLNELKEFVRLLKIPIDPNDVKELFGGANFKPLTLHEFLAKVEFE